MSDRPTTALTANLIEAAQRVCASITEEDIHDLAEHLGGQGHKFAAGMIDLGVAVKGLEGQHVPAADTRPKHCPQCAFGVGGHEPGCPANTGQAVDVLAAKLNDHASSPVVHWEDWAQKAETLMREAAVTLAASQPEPTADVSASNSGSACRSECAEQGEADAVAASPAPAADAGQDASQLLNPDHRLGPPQPLTYPNAEWCEAYQQWFNRAVRYTLKSAADTGQAVEDLAQWLHDEVEWPEYSFPNHTWPLHDKDTGRRDDAFVRLVPMDVVHAFRDIAKRLLSRHPAPLDAERDPACKDRCFLATDPGLVAAAERVREAERERLFDMFERDPEQFGVLASENRAALRQKKGK